MHLFRFQNYFLLISISENPSKHHIKYPYICGKAIRGDNWLNIEKAENL